MSGPARPSDFDPVAARYDATRGGEERGRRLARELDPFLRRDTPVLDIGAGTGVVALGLTELGHRVVAADLSRGMLRQALPRLGGLAVQGDARCLPFRDASFEQAYSVWLLHHVGDIRAALREVARVLRPDGRYLVVPAGADPLGAPDPANEIARGMQRRVLGPKADRCAGNANDLPDLAPAAGLRVAGVYPLEPHSYEESPETLARAIEERAFAYLWDVDEETWRREVEPAIAAIRALPDPDRPVTRRVRPFPMVVLERPPAPLPLSRPAGEG